MEQKIQTKMKRIVFAALLAFPLLCAAQNAESASALIAEGKAAPAFTLKSPDGKNVSLSDFRGKYLLVDFWASWCPDCRKSNPYMVQLHDSLKGKNIRFLGISFDTDAEAWKKCIEKDGLAWTHASELKKWKETAVSKSYGIKWIPTFSYRPQGQGGIHRIGRGRPEGKTERHKVLTNPAVSGSYG